MIAEFATLVGLIGQFRTERGNQAQASFNDFAQWLAKTNHAELKNSLEQNTNATIYIKALLTEDHKKFQEKLEKIDAGLTAVASTIGGFAELARSIKPEAILSEQALSVLMQFEAAGASKVLEIHFLGGSAYQFMDGDGGTLTITDDRFIEDDLNSMVGLGLLRHERNSKGHNVYCYTRAASKLVQGRS